MALVKQIGFTRFSRWGENLGRLHVSAATHTEALDGTDEVKLTCAEDIVKGDHIVWADRQGGVHEHIADSVSRVHAEDGTTQTEATCINSVAELWDDYIEDKRPSGSAALALTSILENTRWEAGACDVEGAASKTFYHTSVREALSDLLDVWGGELETEVETDGATVTARRIRVRALRGDQDSPKRFTWTKDLLSVTRAVGSDNPKTRVYGYGKGVETDGGGYGRRLTFGNVNGGLDYVEDAAATQVWGHLDGKGGISPAVDVYIDEECDDAATLLQETRDYLDTVKTPTVSYTASVLDLYAFGRTWEGVGIGDTVAIIDRGFGDEGVRIKGRVSKLKRDLVTAETEVTFGNLTDAMADMWASVAQALKTGSNARAGYDAVAGTSVGWLTQLQAALNKQFNAVGTYKVESFELGSVYSNVPLNPDGLPVKSSAGMWAVNINGMGIRLASALNAQGEWDWKTFITGSSVTADCINAGTMRADRIRAGLLTDEVGKNYWDLSTGEFSLSAGATVGGEGIATSDATIKSVDVEYAQAASATDAPTEGWQTTAPAWEAGKYIWQRTKTVMQSGAVGYSDPVCISGRDGADGAPGEAGADGKDGTPGKDGKDALPVYFHRAYATSADGSQGFTTTWKDGCRYFGTYVDNTVADSDDPTKYDWTLFVGKDGVEGTPGKDGASGTTYYLHIAYATSADGTQGFSVDDPVGKTYIGQCVDTAKDDPTTPASYTWALIKGADGKDGADGIGISSIQEQYYLSTSSTSQVGGSWSLSQPAWVKGRHYWTRSKVTWSDSKVTYTPPQLARALTASNQAVSDLDTKLTQEEIFNRLTDGGQTQGIYLQDGKVYLNGEYIKAGTVAASRLESSQKLPDGSPVMTMSAEAGSSGAIASGGSKRHWAATVKAGTGPDADTFFHIATQVNLTRLFLAPLDYQESGTDGVSGIAMRGRTAQYQYYVELYPSVGTDGEVTLKAKMTDNSAGYWSSHAEKTLCVLNG
nr:MAG TPA: tail protein [Caudoviricetes sp.]